MNESSSNAATITSHANFTQNARVVVMRIGQAILLLVFVLGTTVAVDVQDLREQDVDELPIGVKRSMSDAATMIRRGLNVDISNDNRRNVMDDQSVNTTSAPVAPAPVTATLAPVTPAPVTAASVTPAPVTPVPVTPAPVTAVPVMPAPVTPAPITVCSSNARSSNCTSGSGSHHHLLCRCGFALHLVAGKEVATSDRHHG